MKISNCLDPNKFEQLMQQALPAHETAQCEAHIEQCAECRRRLERMAGDPQWWQEAAQMLSGDSWKADRIADTADLEDHRHARTATLRQVRQVLQPPSHPEMLGRLGGYDIESFIGQGGFGVVFKAYDSELNRPVAIKVLAPHLASSGVARRRFTREAQAAAAVVHPNVVPIHAVQSEVEFPYLVMTYVPGSSLQSFVQQHGPLDPKTTIRIAQQVAAGLAAAHRQGLVHRDIKPGNILLENGLSRTLITDFGLARAADDAAVSQTGWIAGTPHYMSPEQARGADLDGRSDLFSLGSVMYFMATGREPFRGSQPLSILQKIASEQPLSANRVNSDVPRTLSRIIDRLLEKRPEDRIQSAQQLSELLEHLLAHLQQPQTMALPRLPSSTRQWREFSRFAALAVVVVCLMLGATVLASRILNNSPDESATQDQFKGRAPTVADIIALHSELRESENQAIVSQQEISSLSGLIESVDLSWSNSAIPAFSPSDPIAAEAHQIESQIRALEGELH